MMLLSLLLSFSMHVMAGGPDKPAPETGDPALAQTCEDLLHPFHGKVGKQTTNDKSLKSACQQVQVLDGCRSVKGVPIFHFDRKGNHAAQQRILVFSLIHGDETSAGDVGRFWMERLSEIEPRNSWRVVPMLNPDGVKLRTRTNANKVDVNRNFPTKGWDQEAKHYWEKEAKKANRRFPGDAPGSEPETKCAMKQIEDFKPDFVVSIHTPLKVLDFDGPRVKPPKFDYLPWRNLGNYPGSLGRYLWLERKTPVLTAEFKEDSPPQKPLVELQDIIGFLVSLELKEKSASNVDPNPR